VAGGDGEVDEVGADEAGASGDEEGLRVFSGLDVVRHVYPRPPLCRKVRSRLDLGQDRFFGPLRLNEMARLGRALFLPKLLYRACQEGGMKESHVYTDLWRGLALHGGRRVAVVMMLFLGIVAGGECGGQILHPVGKAPSFEVATIKASPSGDAGGIVLGPQGDDRFVAKNVTVKDLIEFAYTTDSDRQVVGLSGWMTSQRYDIDAKVGEAEVAAMLKLPAMQRMEPYRLMQQTLLADRFKLKVHFETRQLPIYALVVAKGGPKMRASEMNPAKPVETLKARSLGMTGAGSVVASGVTMGMLAEILEEQSEVSGGEGRVVVDKTNLPGLYDWTLHWTPLSGAADGDSNWPSLFTALEEQLGLRLEVQKAPVEVLMIDHVELPSAN
jgi:uncharacterized protein (TIGR03435 family)